MDITTDTYQIAPLNDQKQAVEIIKEAEAAIAEATGNEVTLIAYEKSKNR
ncbi:hypothetical protein [Paenibacillus woosongensis]|nr:hypothetical protein [Paenibacillus woosongensis]